MKQLQQTLFFFLLVTQICFAQWVQTNGHFGCDVLSLVVSGTDVFAGTMNGIYRSTDDGASWTAVDSGLANLEIHSLAVNGTDLFAGTFSSGVFHSPNNGSSWTAINNGLPTGFSGDALAVSGMNLFAGTRSSSGQGIYHSTNNGATWIQTAVNWQCVRALAVNGTNIFAGLHGWNGRIPVPLGVKVSTDNGSTWVYHGLDTFFVNAFAVSGTRAFAGSGHSGIFLSTDNGANWTMTGLNNYSVSAFAVTGTNIFVTADDTAGDGVFLSTNNGKSWTEVSTGLPMIAYVHKLAVSGAHLFAGTYGGSVWRRPLEEMVVPVELKTFIAVANGKEVTLNWSTATELNNQGFEVQRKFGNNEYITIGSVKGHGTTTSPNNYTYIDKLFDAGKYFYRLKQIDFDGKYEYSQTVEANWSPFTTYKLEQNYPNPFNPATAIGFGIPEKGNVKLSVHNILGEEIKVLFNEEKEAGYHSVNFDGSNLPSGVYFYKLTAGNFISTRKMLLLK